MDLTRHYLWTCPRKRAIKTNEQKYVLSREGREFVTRGLNGATWLSVTKSAATLLQATIESHYSALLHLYRHLQYHTTEHCHIGIGIHNIKQIERCHIGTSTDSITQQSTATLVQALKVSHNRAMPHWYSHSQYHTTEHCHIGTGTDSITQQNTATLVQALTVLCNRTLLRGLEAWRKLWLWFQISQKEPQKKAN